MTYHFIFTSEIVRSLQSIERSRAEVTLTVLPPTLVEHMRLQARVRSTHYSTRIEGNRLTLAEAEQVILDGKTFLGRERDTLEVKHYFQALEQVEQWLETEAEITEERVRKLHAVIFAGRRAKATPYRDGQNVIRDMAGGIVYLPPEAKDVPILMAELFSWIHENERELPVPVVAGLAHYQFVTIHPFYDGNGRTARSLATWVLYRGGYDLGRFYSLEEIYAADLQGYYDALVTDPHHNFYDGRINADITSWLAYFLRSMANVFEMVAKEVKSWTAINPPTEPSFLRQLDRRGRIVYGLFEHQAEISANDVARALSLSPRQVRDLLNEWSAQGWLVVSEPSRKLRRYRLSAE